MNVAEDPVVTAEWEAEKAATAQRASQCRAEHPASGRRPGDRIVACLLGRGHPGDHEDVGTGITWSDPPPAAENPDLYTLLRQAGDSKSYQAIGAAYQLGGKHGIEAMREQAEQVADTFAAAPAGLDVEQTIRHHALGHAIEGGPYDPETAEILDLADVFAAYIRDGSRPVSAAVLDLAEWLVSLDDPDHEAGMAQRRTVTLDQIITRARKALGRRTIRTLREPAEDTADVPRSLA